MTVHRRPKKMFERRITTHSHKDLKKYPANGLVVGTWESPIQSSFPYMIGSMRRTLHLSTFTIKIIYMDPMGINHELIEVSVPKYASHLVLKKILSSSRCWTTGTPLSWHPDLMLDFLMMQCLLHPLTSYSQLVQVFYGFFLVGGVTARAPENRPISPKGKDRLPTINFQVLLLTQEILHQSIGSFTPLFTVFFTFQVMIAGFLPSRVY